MTKQLHHRGFHRFHTTNTNYIMMPCLAVWYPDLPHYRLLPKSEPLRAAALQCLLSRMHHRRQCSLHTHTRTHVHTFPRAWRWGGGLNLWSSVGFVYCPTTTTTTTFFTFSLTPTTRVSHTRARRAL